MNFDDVKNSYQSLSYGGDDKETIDFSRKIEDAVEQVRKEDQKDKQRIVSVSILTAGFGLTSGIIGLLKYLENTEGTGYWGYVLYALALVSIVPLLIRKYYQNKHLNYDVPVIQFIEQVEKRFALFQFSQLRLIPFILIINASLVYLMAGSGILTIEIVLRSQIIFILVCTFALLVRVIVWKKKTFILNELRRIKESLLK